MATQAPEAVVADNTALEKMREDLTCMVCADLFTTPKTLPCLHTFCEKCLIAAEEARKKMTRIEDASTCGEDAIMCPACRAVTTIDKGVEGIVTNFTYVNLVEHIKSRDKVVSENEPQFATPKDTTDTEELNNGKKKSWIRSLLPVAGGAVAAGTVAVVAAPIVLPALGFGAGGIVAGSVAAAWQASIGNVVAGSLFASLQSAGVAGLATTTYAGIAATGSAGGAAVGYAVARKRD